MNKIFIIVLLHILCYCRSAIAQWSLNGNNLQAVGTNKILAGVLPGVYPGRFNIAASSDMPHIWLFGGPSVSSSNLSSKFNFNIGGSASLGVISNNNIGSGGIGILNGTNLSSPVVWMFNSTTGNNAFTVASVNYDAAGISAIENNFTSLLQVRENGNVGIGTTTPDHKLQIGNAVGAVSLSLRGQDGLAAGGSLVFEDDQATASRWFKLVNNTLDNKLMFATPEQNNLMVMNRTDGYIGVGTYSPAARFHVAGASGTSPSLIIQNDSYSGANSTGAVSLQFGFANHGAAKIEAFKQNTNTTGINFYTEYGYNVSQLAMTIKSTGNVGIGTTSPGSFKLAVNGKIWGQEVQVAVTNPGPDYVFEKDYALPTLESVKTYIDQNKHLPEVPSAKEMEVNGINLSEMNMLLLKKVEELTLYVIEQQKELTEQKSLNKELLNRVMRMEKLQKEDK